MCELTHESLISGISVTWASGEDGSGEVRVLPVRILRLDASVALLLQLPHCSRVEFWIWKIENKQIVLGGSRARTTGISMGEFQMGSFIWHPEHNSRISDVT
jgi:hypothetical protein